MKRFAQILNYHCTRAKQAWARTKKRTASRKGACNQATDRAEGNAMVDVSRKMFASGRAGKFAAASKLYLAQKERCYARGIT